MRHWFAIFIIVVVCVLAPVGVHNVFAQSRAELEQDLAKLEAQIKVLNGSIAQTQAQKGSLARDISLLNQKIAASKLKIQSHNAAISKLNQNISEKNRTINVLDAKANLEKASSAHI